MHRRHHHVVDRAEQPQCPGSGRVARDAGAAACNLPGPQMRCLDFLNATLSVHYGRNNTVLLLYVLVLTPVW